MLHVLNEFLMFFDADDSLESPSLAFSGYGGRHAPWATSDIPDITGVCCSSTKSCGTPMTALQHAVRLPPHALFPVARLLPAAMQRCRGSILYR